MEREDQLEKLFKVTSRIISEFDSETESMVEKLHKKRDEQVIYILLNKLPKFLLVFSTFSLNVVILTKEMNLATSFEH